MFIKKVIFSLLLFLVWESALLARTVTIPARSRNVCVGNSSRLIQLEYQALWWKVNGRGSRLSTWHYRGTNSTLTLDVDTANVYARCHRVGRETYNISWRVAYSDPNTYQMRYTVNCIPCLDTKSIKKAQIHINKATKLAKEGGIRKLRQAKVQTNLAKKLLGKVLKDKATPANKKPLIKKIIKLLNEALRMLSQFQNPAEQLIQAQQMMKKLLLTQVVIENPIGVEEPIRPIPDYPGEGFPIEVEEQPVQPIILELR